MFPRAEIKQYAKQKFYNNYGSMLGVYVIYLILGSIIVSLSFGLGTFLIMPPFVVGMSFFSYLVYQGQRPEVSQMFTFGFDDYGRKLGGILWSWLFIFLWSLLFLIPGIVKSIAYSMSPYLIAEYKNIPATEVVKVSMKITNGRKGDIFVMYLSFIGWGLLSMVTFGITQIFYSGPYMQVSLAGMYDVLKKDALETGRITKADLGLEYNPNYNNYYGNPNQNQQYQNQNQQNPNQQNNQGTNNQGPNQQS